MAVQEGRGSGKPVEIGGLQKNWKEHVQPQSHSTYVKPSTSKKGSQLRTDATGTTSCSDSSNKPEFDHAAVQHQTSQKTPKTLATTKANVPPGQSNHRGGTKMSGIKLRKVETKNTVDSKPRRRSAKPRYNNSHLPFKNVNHDLQTWCESIIPAIIDWAGTLEDGFGVNAHPNLSEIIQDNWNDEFPTIECDDAVLSVASSAIRNWRSSINKYALQQLTKLLENDPYKNSREQRKEYVAEQLRDLRYIYRDPDTKSGAYHSSVIVEIFAVHQQLVAKTDKFYGYPGGALSLCAAAHKHALKLWRSGDPPDKDTKTSFVRRPWAIRAAAHFQTIKKLSDRKWRVIVEAAVSAMDSHIEEFDPTGENDSELDDPDEVVISEDEAATSD
ncbi:hypothetical protein BYT27DRAFT_7169757 [Phlegmacium glaucopus]|nr:hypothetical protein BYT27DRAFT_7169757 [Phlegmacium glaucopus]